MLTEELEQEPFSSHEFVERLAWRTIGSRGSYDNFDPMLLHSAFEKMIEELKGKNETMESKIQVLEQECTEEEKRHWQRVTELQKRNKSSYSHFQELDERINSVATKVVHLGDQLEGVNTPRAKAVEAQKLINYLNEFLVFSQPKSPVFTDPFQLQQAADIIQKLYQIALELPSGEKFDSARKKIWEKYNHVEGELIEEFKVAHRDNDSKKMKKVASVLSNFKGYGKCIDVFIEMSMKGAFIHGDPFDDVIPLVTKTDAIIQTVFKSPETVLAKLVHTIYHSILQTHAKEKLESKEDPEEYLVTLFQLYTRTTKLSDDLSEFKMGSDSLYLSKLSKTIFLPHLEAYINFETKYLNERCTAHLQRYYESKDHTKRQIQTGGFSEIRKELQAKLVGKASINFGPTIEDYKGETFLSQEVTGSLLQEAKNAYKRCQMLSSNSQLAGNALKIFDVLVEYLIAQHIDYAVELALQSIPLPDPKSQPVIYFFDVVGQANALFHLFDKNFLDCLVPLVMSSPKHGQCLQRKRELRDQLEGKIDTGLDKSLAAITGWVRNILSVEQKKTDFKPEDENVLAQMVSPACSKVVRFMSAISTSIHNSLDGKNVDVVLAELGVRFHRVIFDHLMNFQYNSLGAMLVICDVNEYRRCVKEFKIELVTELFEKLHALCNLLVVVPDNIKQVCATDQLATLDKTVLNSILQLRTDYKTAKLATILK